MVFVPAAAYRKLAMKWHPVGHGACPFLDLLCATTYTRVGLSSCLVEGSDVMPGPQPPGGVPPPAGTAFIPASVPWTRHDTPAHQLPHAFYHHG